MIQRTGANGRDALAHSLMDVRAVAAYGEIFSAVPTAGFSTYGEEFIGHMNQTSTIVCFRR
jgi:hypothetical protein